MYKSNKLECKEFEVLIVDNFVSLVRAHKFMLGQISDYRVVEEFFHLFCGEKWDIITNTMNSSSICLPFNASVATVITWNLKTLSKFFAIYPLSIESMENNVLYSLLEMESLERRNPLGACGSVTYSSVLNKANKCNLLDRSGKHKENLHLLDSIY